MIGPLPRDWLSSKIHGLHGNIRRKRRHSHAPRDVTHFPEFKNIMIGIQHRTVYVPSLDGNTLLEFDNLQVSQVAMSALDI